ncbi:hypothetical protein DI09_13p360 [Mitosporidium daphniae]|uniref:Uncharacterized protein n=1 Tax=Mitosporidium daphniae TaxID=1485682 RepID=A0A098VUV5_9MICR|nr:uncharacterized protein DI09_13p360 [Mitosporidium daphniae]KGG52747.1 hypothetical protein DI09_13p360 [Mitosporidium daphniae]|eukprot:XP_013239174.1 uncharacterized protein DI09_13p360 [Mitosporidium daphniae]
MLAEGQKPSLFPSTFSKGQKENEILDVSLKGNSENVLSKISQIASMIGRKNTTVVAVTGAGISVNAGIPVIYASYG